MVHETFDLNFFTYYFPLEKQRQLAEANEQEVSTSPYYSLNDDGSVNWGYGGY